MNRMTKKVSSVSTSMVAVTATPYAPARFDEEPKPTTAAITAAHSSQFTEGMYTCPISRAEVWTMVMRGRKPSCTACLVSENAPEIVACDAITVAAVASAIIGYRAQPGSSR
jgi:hypothetical protein